jgi:hypothetical protein
LARSAIDAAINSKPFDEKTLINALNSALLIAGMASGAKTIRDAVAHGELNAQPVQLGGCRFRCQRRRCASVKTEKIQFAGCFTFLSYL